MSKSTFTFKNIKFEALESYQDKIIAKNPKGSICVIDLVGDSMIIVHEKRHLIPSYENEKQYLNFEIEPKSVDEGMKFIDDCMALIEEKKFDYMMLNRLQMDMDYYLGASNGAEKHLYYHNVEDHIEEVKKLYNSFPDPIKPQWLTADDLEEYKSKMYNLKSQSS